jgi:hypothetical protein
MAGDLRDLLYAKERLEEVAGMLGPEADASVPEDKRVLGVVVEIGLQPSEVMMAADAEAVASGTGPGMTFLMPEAVMIAGYANGDARLLRTSGGGLLGDLYQFPNIAEAAKALCAAAQPLVEKLSPRSGLPPLPAVDMVQFTVLTIGQLYSSQAPGPEVIKPGHVLHEVDTAALHLFEQLRALQEQANAQTGQSSAEK